MRFSLKWILAGVAYVAIAAAAFSQTTWVYADILWAASLLAVVYAALLAAFVRGRRQLAAAGFVFASFCFLMCLTLGGDSVPTTRLLVAAGVGAANQPLPAPTPTTPYNPSMYFQVVPPQGTPSAGLPSTTSSASAGVLGIAAPSNNSMMPTAPAYGLFASAAPTVAPAAFPPIDYGIYVRAGNAVGMMVVGLMGSVLGALVHRAATRANSLATNPIP
jgi:hypothetical protein